MANSSVDIILTTYYPRWADKYCNNVMNICLDHIRYASGKYKPWHHLFCLIVIYIFSGIIIGKYEICYEFQFFYHILEEICLCFSVLCVPCTVWAFTYNYPFILHRTGFALMYYNIPFINTYTYIQRK